MFLCFQDQIFLPFCKLLLELCQADQEYFGRIGTFALILRFFCSIRVICVCWHLLNSGIFPLSVVFLKRSVVTTISLSTLRFPPPISLIHHPPFIILIHYPASIIHRPLSSSISTFHYPQFRGRSLLRAGSSWRPRHAHSFHGRFSGPCKHHNC